MNVGLNPTQAEHCPSAQRVREACAGCSNDAELAEIEQHLAACAACSEIVASLDDANEASDALVQALSALPSSTDDEAAFQDLQSTLLTMSPAGAAAAGVRRLADPPIGTLPQTLGNYELVACIGRGAWGAIYRARHLKLDQVVAVKVLDATRLHLAPAVEHFVQEMKAVGQLQHPNIVRATDAGEDRGFHYLVMEYLHGVDAARVLRCEQELAIADACEIVRQAALALDYAHRRSWVHRDVKPSNLMITTAGQVKLLDLGIAGRRDVDQAPLAEQTPLGTAEYMAPEQWTDFAAVDARADVYSLGNTLYKLLTGRSPTPGGGTTEAAQRDQALAPPLASLRSDVRRGLQRVVDKMRATRREDRYQTAAEAAAALQPWTRRANLKKLAARLQPISPPPHELADQNAIAHHSSARPTRRALIATAASLAGAGVCALWFFNRRAPQLRRSVWRPLRPVEPQLLLSAEPSQRVAVDLQRAGQISLRSSDALLINLGRAVAGPFALRVAIAQESATGGSGVFFRWRRTSEQPLIVQFQSIELTTEPDGQQPSGPRLLWNKWTARRDEQTLILERDTLAEASVENVAPDQKQQLTVTLGRNGVPEVQHNGRPLGASDWTLSTDGRRYANLEPSRLEYEFLGGVGVINSSGAASYYSPELTYL